MSDWAADKAALVAAQFLLEMEKHIPEIEHWRVLKDEKVGAATSFIVEALREAEQRGYDRCAAAWKPL